MPNELIKFEDFAFSPAEGLRDHAYSPTEPENEEAIRGQIQGVSDQLRDHLNALQRQLNSVEAGTAGAQRIGAAAIAGLEGQTVARQLASLKNLIDQTAVGAIPDNTLSAAKLKDGAVTGPKLAAEAVTAEKLAPGCVSHEKLADGAVTAEKLGDGLGDFHESYLITESCNWSPPYDGIYTVTLLGGGGGGGSGFAVYDTTLNSNSNYPRTFFCGAGGDASVAVSKRFALYQEESYTFVIGAGGMGRTGNAYVLNSAGSGPSTMPTFSSCDGFASAGGESSLSFGAEELLKTSQRISGCAFACYVPLTLSSSQSTLLGGASGAGYLPGLRNSVKISDSEITESGGDLVIEAGPGRMGGGNGGEFSLSRHIAGQASPGGSAKGYGCGGGGGCAPYINRTTPKSNAKYSFINAGGNGGNGYALIEWFAPLALPQD